MAWTSTWIHRRRVWASSGRLPQVSVIHQISVNSGFSFAVRGSSCKITRTRTISSAAASAPYRLLVRLALWLGCHSSPAVKRVKTDGLSLACDPTGVSPSIGVDVRVLREGECAIGSYPAGRGHAN